jgi:hypothetical protein
MTAGDEITRVATRAVATSADDGPVAQLQDIASKALRGLTVLAGLLDNLAARVGRLESLQQQTDTLDAAALLRDCRKEIATLAKTGEDAQRNQALLDDLSARVGRLESAHRSTDALDVAAQLIRKEIARLTRTIGWSKL